MNEPDAVCPPTSVAMTDVPEVPPGTANVQENPPAEFATSEPVEHVDTAIPSKSNDASAVDTENPEPDTVTVAPTGPCPGVTEITGVVTVNVPLADFPPASVAVTVEPEVSPGTLNVHEKVPVAPAVNDPDEQLSIATESNTKEASAVETEKPVPDTVTAAPTGPWPGVIEMATVETMNETTLVWVSVVTSVPTMLYDPAGWFGTVNVQEKAPLGFVVIVEPLAIPTEQPVAVSTIPLKATVASSLTVKPAPSTTKEAPTGPWAGETVIAGVVTVKVAVAVWPPLFVATTELPVVSDGTENPQDQSPSEFVVREPVVQLATVTPSKTSDAT